MSKHQSLITIYCLCYITCQVNHYFIVNIALYFSAPTTTTEAPISTAAEAEVMTTAAADDGVTDGVTGSASRPVAMMACTNVLVIGGVYLMTQ